jgi:hypothetical protein
MKKLLLILLFPLLLSAQTPAAPTISSDAQLHWDFHREQFLSTIEIFETDRWGTVFFFTDFHYGSAGQTDAYFEITRDEAVWRLRGVTWNLSLQYNDGVQPTDAATGKAIPRTVLLGIAANDLHWGKATFELQALARQEFAAELGWQLTAVWFWPIPKTPLEFLGYVDWNTNETNDQPISVQTQPQLQARFGRFAIGSEWEFSRNFTGAFTKKHGFAYHTWYAHPTAFLRVDF